MKKLVFLLALLHTPAWATWTQVQQTCNAACTNSTTCAITVSSTGTGNLIAVSSIVDFAGATPTLSSVSGGGTYTHCTNCNSTANGNGSIDASYTLASTSGATSITLTLSALPGSAWRACMTEASSSTGGIALDTGATPSGNRAQTSATTNPAGVSLTLSGANAVIVQGALWSGSISAITAGWTGTFPNGNGYGNIVNTTSGTAPTWTATSGTGGFFGIAFKENAGGGFTPGSNKADKLQNLEGGQ